MLIASHCSPHVQKKGTGSSRSRCRSVVEVVSILMLLAALFSQPTHVSGADISYVYDNERTHKSDLSRQHVDELYL